MQVSTHLWFDGQCETAFRTYARILGGRLTTMLAYGDSPMAEEIQPQLRSKILHASLEFDNGCDLRGSDMILSKFERPQGFIVTLSMDNLERTKYLFDALAEGGQILMSFEQTFWSAGFGAVVDRFGTPWELNCMVLPNPD